MCFKKLFRKKTTPEPAKPEPVVLKQETPIPIQPQRPEVAKEPEALKPESKPESKPEAKPDAAKTAETKYHGKYEIYPEAGFFKYRLKASNGEILIVSQGYTSEKGALAGIETLKKNLGTGKFSFYTDKSGFSQFFLMNETAARVIAVGEFYESVKKAESAAESVKRFYDTDKIEKLSKLPKAEIREELLSLAEIEQKATGKYEVQKEEGKWTFLLKASNAEVLFTSSKYASKASVLSAIDSVKKAIEDKHFSVTKDKQGRFQFKLYSANSQLLLTGETYPTKEVCESAVDSVRRFGLKAKIVEL